MCGDSAFPVVCGLCCCLPLESIKQVTIATALGSDGKASAYNEGDWVRSLGQEDPLEKEMATHSSTLAWKIPWTEPPGKIISLSLRSGKCIPQKTDLKEHPQILM